MNKFIDILFNKQEVEGQHWRWFFIPVAPIIFGILAGLAVFALNFVQLYLLNPSDVWMFEFIIPMVSSGACAWVFIKSTYYIAPKFKAITCKVFCAFFGLVAIFVLMSAFLAPTPEEGEWFVAIRSVLIFVVMLLTTQYLVNRSRK